MALTFLAPYNETMKLGQGFNSFLQRPCADEAVKFPSGLDRTPGTNAGDVSQVVTYNSRFVERLSEVVRGMNISAGASVKSGSIYHSGSALAVDEVKFNSSDLNAVISVKIGGPSLSAASNANSMLRHESNADGLPQPRLVRLPHTTRALWLTSSSKPLSLDTQLDSSKFFDIYGDCYISGFVEGGELHGIVSIKILNASRRREIENAVKSQLNSTGGGKFTLNNGKVGSKLDSLLRETETTITVSWSGGGQIKPDGQEWSLESLFQAAAAAAFPSRVAVCPQRAWAVLTPYKNNLNVRQYTENHGITFPNFTNLASYASDLLDMFMQYKYNLGLVQDMISHIADYEASTESEAIPVTYQALFDTKKLMKKSMHSIVLLIDKLNSNPSTEPPSIKDPELWATQLPVRKKLGVRGADATTQAILKDLPISTTLPPPPAAPAPNPLPQPPAAPQPAPQPNTQSPVAFLSDAAYKSLLDVEKKIATAENDKKWSTYRFTPLDGLDSGNLFCGLDTLTYDPPRWPTKIEWLQFFQYGQVVAWLRFTYPDNVQVAVGTPPIQGEVSQTVDFDAGEKMLNVTVGVYQPLNIKQIGVGHIKITTSTGRVITMGTNDTSAMRLSEYKPTDGTSGIITFWGRKTSLYPHRLGFVYR